MKHLFLLSLFILSSTLFLKAQFSSDATKPLSVCDTTGTQASVVAFADGKGGYYTFWLDKRAGGNSSDVYGQRFTSGGTREWEANGRLIINANGKNVTDVRCVPWQNGLLMAWMQTTFTSPDTLFCRYLDTNAAPIWPTPMLVADKGTGIYLEDDGFNIFPNSLGATIAYGVTGYGGYDFFCFNRMDFTGKLRWAADNFLINYGYDNFKSCSDGFGGVYALFRDNGIGSPMTMQHFDTSGAAVFSAPLIFTLNPGGVTNSGVVNFNTDVSGNLYITWDDDDSSGKVLMTKITPSGSFAWTPAYQHVSNVKSGQSYSHSIISGRKIYTIWDDDRTAPGGNLSFYIQRTDTTGVNDWTPGGVKVCNMNCYSPHPKIALSDSGSVIAFYETNNGLYGQKIRADTSVEYPVNGQYLVNQNQDPDYGDFVLVDNGSSCAAGFWSTFGGDIYTAQLCSPEIETGVKNEVAETALRLFPNPSSSFINWAIPNTEADNLTISITDLSGRQVYDENTHASSGIIDVSTLSKGMYILQSVSGKSTYSRKLIVE